MASYNDITGDKIQSRTNTQQFEDNFDKIFRKTKTEVADATPAPDKPLDYAEDWQPEARARAIAQNGNSGDHYKEK